MRSAAWSSSSIRRWRPPDRCPAGYRLGSGTGGCGGCRHRTAPPSTRSPTAGSPPTKASCEQGHSCAAGGILLLATLGSMIDDTLVRLNALKNALSGFANAVAAIAFTIWAPVHWAYVPPLAAGFPDRPIHRTPHHSQGSGGHLPCGHRAVRTGARGEAGSVRLPATRQIRTNHENWPTGLAP